MHITYILQTYIHIRAIYILKMKISQKYTYIHTFRYIWPHTHTHIHTHTYIGYIYTYYAHITNTFILNESCILTYTFMHTHAHYICTYIFHIFFIFPKETIIPLVFRKVYIQQSPYIYVHMPTMLYVLQTYIHKHIYICYMHVYT